MKSGDISKLIIAIAVSEFAGIIGSVFTAPSIPAWYSTLAKPVFTPPSWVFAPVWTTLFALMGVAAFLAWRYGFERKDVKVALAIFAGQLVLNTFWSIIFFGLRNPGAAFVEIIFLWLAILATIIAFYKISRPAAWLLIPYIIWVSFAGFLNYSIWQLSAGAPEPVFCTMDAKLCADGSYVSRTGPKCEFAECPAPKTEPGWKTFNDSGRGISFQYPGALSTKYIRALDWPPQVQIIDGPYSCVEAGSEIAPAGKTEKRLVDNREYCRTTENQGAAGSVYTQYAYAFPRNNKVVIFTFTTRATQCGNYPEPQKTECENERSSFDIDGVINRVAQTLQLNLTGSAEISSGINGAVSLGPTCPVVKNPPEPQCADKSYSADFLVSIFGQGQTIARFKSDANGKFSVSVPPGSYIIKPAVTSSIYPRCQNSDVINVSIGKYAEAAIYCDTGIR